jgi:hypothetical protein
MDWTAPRMLLWNSCAVHEREAMMRWKVPKIDNKPHEKSKLNLSEDCFFDAPYERASEDISVRQDFGLAIAAAGEDHAVYIKRSLPCIDNIHNEISNGKQSRNALVENSVIVKVQ